MRQNRCSLSFVRRACMVLCALVLGAFSFAENFPAHSIKVIVPFGPGGSGDLTTRTLLQYADLGQPTVVINMPGAGDVIGTMEAFHSAPDGYTLLANTPAGMIVAGLKGLYPEAVFRTMIPIITMGLDNPVFCVSGKSQFKDAKGFFEYVKANPGKLNLASVGMSSMYTSSLVIKDSVGIDLNYVSFDSSTKSRAALLGGHVDCLLATISENKALISSGDLRPLFVLSEKRSPFLPEVPTMIELGYNVTGCLGTRGVWAPANTPKPIIDKIEEALLKAAKNPAFQKVFADDMCIEPVAWDSATTRAWVDKNASYYKALLEKYAKK